MRRNFWGFGMGLFIFSAVAFASADYTEELRKQMAEVGKNHPKTELNYFHDMGIVTRKADEAGLPELTAEMVRGMMLDMEDLIKKELNEINDQYESDSFHATRRLSEMIRYERYYQPTDDFLKTASGQAVNTDLIQFRTNAIESLSKSCSSESILQGIQSLKKTGLYLTNSSAEITALRNLSEGVSCCVSWKPELVFSRNQEFETDYEVGASSEEGHLRLESNRTDLSEARWVGEWIYRVTGREGKGEGVSQAVLTYHRGQELATLAISPSRVSSSGRMNFPTALSGEKRTLTVSGTPVDPTFVYYGQEHHATGCRAEILKSELRKKA